jgi:endonuclease YncB( thermonuclease family)
MRLFIYPIRKIIKVIDGDSLRVILDQGRKVYSEVDLRLMHIDAPERRGSQREAGLLVTDVVSKWVAKYPELLAISHKMDKYGRMLATVTYQYPAMTDTMDLNTYLHAHKLAHVYDGTGKRVWSQEELSDIVRRCGELLK